MAGRKKKARKKLKELEAVLSEYADQAPDSSDVEEWRDQLLSKLPDKKELVGYKDDLVDALPSKKELKKLRNTLIDELPDSVVDKLPVEKSSKFGAVKKIAVVGIAAAAVGALVAFVRAKLADDSTPPYNPPPPPPAAATTSPN